MCFAFCGDKEQGAGDCSPVGQGLGSQPWETPIGFVRPESFPVLRRIERAGHGDMPPWGHGPSPSQVTHLDRAAFPKLDYFQSCKRG